MSTSEVISRIRRGEDSMTQFKRQAIGVAKLADEMVAFANAEGGVILFGGNDSAGSYYRDRDANWLKAIIRRAMQVDSTVDAQNSTAGGENGTVQLKVGQKTQEVEYKPDPTQFKSGPKTVSSGQEVTQKWPKSGPETVQKLSASTRQIYEALREEPRLTYRSLASKLGFVKETIRKGIGTLVKEGLVRRVGPKKGGRWVINCEEMFENGGRKERT